MAVYGCGGHPHARVEVIDTGPGLPATVAELTRGAQRGRGRRGRGLAIAAAVAAGHGGRLSAAPSEQGARLVLELPVVRRRRPAPADAVELPGGGGAGGRPRSTCLTR